MSELDIEITPSVLSSLIDATLERSVVSSLLYRPDLMEQLHDRLDLTTLGDFQARAVWEALVNIKHGGGTITADSVASYLADKGRDGAVDWYPRLVDAAPRVIRPDALREQSYAIVKLADKRARAIEVGEEMIAQDSTADVAPRSPKWRIESATPEWIKTPLPPREHLLTDARTDRGAMDKTGVWLFAGAGGAGKSYSEISLCVAVTSGTSWLNTFKVAAPGRTLIIAAEDSCEDIRRRYHAIAKAQGTPADATERFSILPIHDRVTSLVARVGDAFAPSDDTKSLCDELARLDPYDLVVVDPYGRIAGVSVDADNAAAAATISALAMISSAARGLVHGVTHTSLRARIAAQNGAAEGSTGVRGATGQTDYARGVLRLENDRDVIWLSLAKANHVAPWNPVGLRRGDHGELVPIDAADLAQIAASRSSEGKAAKREADIGKRNELDDAAAREAIADNPGKAFRVLRAIVMKARACGKDRATDALHRCAQ